MAHDDRDLNFEKALARHVRSSSPGLDAPPAGGASVGGALPTSCPDPETLAAYHDGSLTPDELSFWKQHVVGCDDCQLVLAHLATPLDVPVNLEKAAATPIAATPAISAQAVANKVRALDSKPVAARRPPSMRWVWLLPAGALAAGLIAWIAIQQQKPGLLVPASSVEVAENRPASANAPLSQSAPGDALSTKESDRAKDQSSSPARIRTGEANSQTRDDGSNELRKQSPVIQQSHSGAQANNSLNGVVGELKQDGQRTSMGSGAGNAPAVVGGALDQKKSEAMVSPKPAGAPRQDAVNPPPPPAPAALEQANGQPAFIDGTSAATLADKVPYAPAPAPTASGAAGVAKAKAGAADAISATSQSVEVSSDNLTQSQIRMQNRAIMLAAVLQDPHVFSAPGGKQLWRFGTNGMLEHSTNNGAKWSKQTTGVSTDLLAGSAPSEKVSWIVGRSGTILRTTDGGSHWAKVVSPVTNDLTGIRATDALHATINFVLDSAKNTLGKYQTTDGGITWTLTNE